MTLIQGAQGIFTGLPGEAMRASGAIRIADGRIAAVGALERRDGEDVIDASGCVIYPGLVSTHHHLFQCVLKGVRAGIDVPLLQWLRAVPYSYWHKIDEEALRTAARIGLAELILSGTTTAADHHYLFAESYRYDPSHVIFEVAAELGIRLVFCRGGATKARSFDTPDLVPTPSEPLDKMIASVEACAQRYHDPSPHSLRRVPIAPTPPPWSLEAGELNVVARSPRAGPAIHGHLKPRRRGFCLAARQASCAMDGRSRYLGRDVWLAHLVHVDDDEISILAHTGTSMAHCPQSNCRLGSGIAPAERLAALGGTVSLAVDGAASNESADMISEMNSAWHTHRAVKGAGAVSIEEVVRWGSANGARVLGFEEAGVIAPGKLADIAVFDLSHPRYFGLHDPLIGPVAGAGTPQLRHLIIGGRIVVENSEIPGLDLAKLRHDAASVVSRLMA